jgi:hypothetical protein
MKYIKIGNSLYILFFALPIMSLAYLIGFIFCVQPIDIYYKEREMMKKASPMICQIKTYRKQYGTLPNSISKISIERGLKDKVTYENKDDENFTISIDNGFDIFATYESMKDSWSSRDAPFPLKNEIIRSDCSKKVVIS